MRKIKKSTAQYLALVANGIFSYISIQGIRFTVTVVGMHYYQVTSDKFLELEVKKQLTAEWNAKLQKLNLIFQATVLKEQKVIYSQFSTFLETVNLRYSRYDAKNAHTGNTPDTKEVENDEGVLENVRPGN